MLKRFWPLCLILLAFACKKQSDFSPVNANEYLPLEIGHYIDYDLDSLVFLDFGTIRTILHFQAREVVEGTLTDNMGRPSYRVARYLRNNPEEEWNPSISYMVTPTRNSIEVMENNLRYIKLTSPVRQDYSWKGNSYIDNFSTDLNMNFLGDWDYTFDSVGLPLTYGLISFDNTVKVDQIDELLGQDPELEETPYSERNLSYEKYAKGIGLIERNFLHWEYQAIPGRQPYYTGYGISMVITGYGTL